MKKIFIIVLCLALIFSTVGCGSEKPEQAVANMLDAIKMADKEEAEKYINYDELISKDEANSFFNDEEEITKLLFKNLSYEILSSEENGDKAKVEVNITNVDMKPIMGEMFTSLISLAFLGLSEDEIEERTKETFINLVNREDNKTITNTVTIDLSKEDNKWKIDAKDELTTAILGGLGAPQEDTLREIDDWLVGDIWDKGFCDFSWYSYGGTDSTGKNIDIEFALQQFESSIKDKEEYDKYIENLEGEEYQNVKNIWVKLSSEIDSLYSQIKKNPPKAKDQNTHVDSGKLQQYMDAFSEAIAELE